MKFWYQKIPFLGHDPRKALVARPFIPVYLHDKERSLRSPYYALLDSGADNILFPTELVTEFKSINLRTCPRETVIGIAGQSAEIYLCDLWLQVVGHQTRLPSTIGFSDMIFVPILGRSFFRNFKAVIFDETKQVVELKTR